MDSNGVQAPRRSSAYSPALAPRELSRRNNLDVDIKEVVSPRCGARLGVHAAGLGRA